MGVSVSPIYAAWVARYPEFSAIDEPTYLLYFGEATLFCRNDGGGPVCDPSIQSTLLNMATAHIAALYSQSQGDAAPGNPKDAGTPVGRINSATQGSVSFTAEYAAQVSQSMAWWVQTKYGASFWAATAPYRQVRYNPGLCAGYVLPGGFGGYRGY